MNIIIVIKDRSFKLKNSNLKILLYQLLTLII